MGIFSMPSLGADMEAGTLTEWLVRPGQSVSRGDVVAVVETEKGAIEIEIFQTGEVVDLVAAIGDTLPVGAPMAMIRVEGEDSEDEVGELSAFQIESEVTPATSKIPVQQASDFPANGAPPSSPAARNRAEEASLDLSTIRGTGPGGAITLQDVESYLSESKQSGRPSDRKAGFDPTAMRKAVATVMTRSKQEIPHFYLMHRVDLERAVEWLTEFNVKRPPSERILMGLLLARAVARAAKDSADMNGFFKDGRFERSEAVHVGMAVSLRGGGLVAPALHDLADIELDEAMVRMRNLVSRARTGRLRSSEFSDPTITVSSLGERGVDAMFGVIFPPQVAIVGFGSPVQRPCVVDGAIAIRWNVETTLSADHRVSDGRAGARFLADISTLLQTPEKL